PAPAALPPLSIQHCARMERGCSSLVGAGGAGRKRRNLKGRNFGVSMPHPTPGPAGYPLPSPRGMTRRFEFIRGEGRGRLVSAVDFLEGWADFLRGPRHLFSGRSDQGREVRDRLEVAAEDVAVHYSHALASQRPISP